MNSVLRIQYVKKSRSPLNMSLTLYGPLAGLLIIFIMLLSVLVDISNTMSISAERSATLQMDSNGSVIFDLPTQLDEDEVLQEYGRFTLASMNQSVDPCEDFYEYACGNWKHSNFIPSRSRNSTFLSIIQKKIDEMVGRFLSNVTEKDLYVNTAESKAKTFFKSCLHASNNMSQGYKLVVLEMEEFTQRLGKTYEVNKTLDWININFISNYGVYTLLPLKIQYDTESRKFEVLLSTTGNVLSNPDVVDIKNLTRDFLIDGEENLKLFTEEFKQMVEFEKNLTSHSNKRNETQHITLSEFKLQHKADALNWTRFFDIAFNGSAKNDWIIQNTIEDVNPLVRFLQKSSLSTLRNFVKWRTLIKFYYIWKAEAADKLIESKCREHTEQYFNYALMPWFIDNVYDTDRRADILQLAKQIKQTFYDMISKYTWLDEETRSNAKTKLRSMDISVGYSDEMHHPDVINQVYDGIEMSDNWFKNLQTVEKNRARVRLRSANKAIIPPLMSTRDVNAYYADFLNLAFIAIGISQQPFYHIKFPPALKFGGIGNIIGHEIAHGFDSYCYKFNYDGKKQNWWTEASLRNFKERYRCLESQYNKFIFHGTQTNGSLTSGDNIADNVGTRISYYAYMNSYGKLDAEKKPLPGVNFTNKQWYFIKFAQTWCTGKDDAYKVRRMKTDVHAYEEFRVVGTLQNMPEFSDAFNCKLGTDMNPLKKCIVW